MQVQITIRGRQYTVRGDDTSVDIQDVARELDARMSAIAGRTQTMDDYTIAMLTALNLAGDLRRQRIQQSERLSEIDRELAGVAAMLESALPELSGE